MDGIFWEILGNVMTYAGVLIATYGVYLLVMSALEAGKYHPIKTHIRANLQWTQIFDLPDTCKSFRMLEKSMKQLTLGLSDSHKDLHQRELLTEYYRVARNAIKQNQTASAGRFRFRAVNQKIA